MATLEELLQNYVKADYETLIALGKDAFVKLWPACKAVDEEHNGFFMMTSILLSAVGADGVLTAKEKSFISEVMGLDDEQINTLIGMYNPAAADLVDSFADKMPTEIKTAVLQYVTAVAAIDEKISCEETAFIRKILA